MTDGTGFFTYHSFAIFVEVSIFGFPNENSGRSYLRRVLSFLPGLLWVGKPKSNPSEMSWTRFSVTVSGTVMTGVDTRFECRGVVLISGAIDGVVGEWTGIVFEPLENGVLNGTDIMPGEVAGVIDAAGVVMLGNCGDGDEMEPNVPDEVAGDVCGDTATGVWGCTKSKAFGDSGTISSNVFTGDRGLFPKSGMTGLDGAGFFKRSSPNFGNCCFLNASGIGPNPTPESPPMMAESVLSLSGFCEMPFISG